MSRGFLSEREVQKSDLVDLELEVRASTEKAVRVFDGEVTCWLPRSQIEMNGQTITMPRWLAEERKLL